MPTLLETQHAMRASLVEGEDGAAAAMLADGISADRLNIYRNTFMTTVTKALRLTYPAIDRLVGAEFFDGAAAWFIQRHPPRTAYFDQYGEEFPNFLRSFQLAGSLVYLADVARLEWAVSRAIHAADVAPLDLAQLAALSPQDQARVCFEPHPSVSLLRANAPADAIWRGVLNGDDAALGAIDLNAGRVHLLVERRDTGVVVSRLDEAPWHFATELCSGWPLGAALAGATGHSPDVLLAEHLGAGRFGGFRLAPPELAASLAAMPELAQ